MAHRAVDASDNTHALVAAGGSILGHFYSIVESLSGSRGRRFTMWDSQYHEYPLIRNRISENS
jgi:hypothetical protein